MNKKISAGQYAVYISLFVLGCGYILRWYGIYLENVSVNNI